jgi:hypothetical protein
VSHTAQVTLRVVSRRKNTTPVFMVITVVIITYDSYGFTFVNRLIDSNDQMDARSRSDIILIAQIGGIIGGPCINRPYGSY